MGINIQAAVLWILVCAMVILFANQLKSINSRLDKLEQQPREIRAERLIIVSDEGQLYLDGATVKLEGVEWQI